MKYKVIERKNPQEPHEQGKYYAIAVNAGTLTIHDFANEIAGRSSLTRGDVENVLNNFLDELPTFLKLGMSIKLGELGTLRASPISEGANTPEEFKSDLIKGVKTIFTPSSDLKKSLADTTFDKVII
jgi:predicted histone-like DNA-binding protein